MPTIGRPRALSDGQRRDICAILSLGFGLSTAARYVGCNQRTIRREAIRNQDFHHQLRSAELQSQISPLQELQKAATTNWRAAAWLLERTDPDRFGRRKPVPPVATDIADVLIMEIFQALGDEIKDPALTHRISVVSQALLAKYGQEAWAQTHHRRDPGRAKRLLDEFEKSCAAKARQEAAAMSAFAPSYPFEDEFDDKYFDDDSLDKLDPEQNQAPESPAACSHESDRSGQKSGDFCTGELPQTSEISDSTANPAAQNPRLLSDKK